MELTPLLTTTQVAKWMNVSPRYVRKLVERGMLEAIRLRSDRGAVKPIYRFSRQAVAKFLGVDVPAYQPSARECEIEASLATVRLRQRLQVLRDKRKRRRCG